MKKKLTALLLALSIVLALSACGGTDSPAAPSASPSAPAEPAPAESATAGAMAGDMPDDEYERAIWYGFIDAALAAEGDRTVTWGEYCAMIGEMLYAVDDEYGDEWQELAALALTSDETMLREQGCFALYSAADLTGEALNDGGIRGFSTNPHLLPSNDGTLPYSYDYTEFTGEDNGEWVYSEPYEGLFGEMDYLTAAVMFCQFRMSLCSFETLYDTQGDITAPLTVEEAALSVLRLYELTYEPVQEFWLSRLEAMDAEMAALGEPEEVTQLREQILSSETSIVKSDTLIPGQTYTGTAYYVSEANGDDSNDGLSPETAWATLDRVNDAPLSRSDAVFFERGGTYRGNLYLYNPDGYITLSAYGEGPKPVLTSAEECAAGADKWSLWYDEDGVKIWKYYKDCLDCGLIVFNDSEAGYKVLADWSGTEWVNEDGTPFDIAASLTENLDFFSDDGGKYGGATTFSVDGENPDAVQYGPLYLRCDEGNPGELYDCIEICDMTVTEMNDVGYEGTVIMGLYGTVCDNLSIKYFPMGGLCPGPNEDCVVQNCEIAWGGGCVQYVEDGRVAGQMGDAINGIGSRSSSINGNYIHDVRSSAIIVESYPDLHVSDVSFSGNLIERVGNGVNINDNGSTSFENAALTDNAFYLVGASWPLEQDVRSGRMFSGEWLACFRIRDPYEYTNCEISGNSMYYPLQFFYYCDVPLPSMSDNLYVSSRYTLNFADIRYDAEIGPYIPVSLDEAEDTIRDLFGDSSSVIRH